MPWALEHYPPAMRRMPVVMRAKAIEIANALLERGEDEGRAIRIGIAQARRWARRRELDYREASHAPWP
jgi:uncharacterized protein YdaT